MEAECSGNKRAIHMPLRGRQDGEHVQEDKLSLCVRFLAGLFAMTHFPSVCSQALECHFHHMLTLNSIYSVPWEFGASGLNYLTVQWCTYTHT